VVVFQDITHIKEAERARIQFIQTAAHDLRNPLGVTLSALTMLRKGWKEPTPTETEVFGIAIRGVNRMQDLIDDLLHLEKLESGIDFAIGPVDVYELVSYSAADVGPLLHRRNQNLKVEIRPGIPNIPGNSTWLARALANLLSNAHKYGVDEGTIILRAYCKAGQVAIEVCDDGPGIPIESQGRLFERFYRVPQTQDKTHGTGLGLAIVKSIIEKHHGTIEVNSAPGMGTTFRLRLPIELPTTA
jgi:two-component system phosphate regulon sensor histidine kinase PhoR